MNADAEVIDWREWEYDRDGNRIDDRLEAALDSYTDKEGRLQANIHLKSIPDRDRLAGLIADMELLGIRPEFVRSGIRTTCLYMTLSGVTPESSLAAL